VRPFLEEVQRAEALLEEIGPVPRPLTKPRAAVTSLEPQGDTTYVNE